MAQRTAQGHMTVTRQRNGEDGRGIKEVIEYYAVSGSNTVAPTSWSTSIPTITATYPYLWKYIKTVYTDGTGTDTEPFLTGVFGQGVKAQYSKYTYTDAGYDHLWHDTFKDGDLYMRTSTDGGQTWGAWGRIVGEDGKDGTDGTNGTYIDYSFAISSQKTTSSVTTAPSIYGSWSDAPVSTTTTYPYLWCRMRPVDSGGWYGTATYVRLTGEQGPQGDKGDTGEQGIQGCVCRVSEWASGVEYRNDSLLTTSGIRYIDIVVVTTGANTFDAYQCKVTHTSSSIIKYTNTAYWTKFNNLAPIYTPLIMAQNAVLKFMQGNQLLIMDSDASTIVAGLVGGSYPLWIGDTTAANAPFKVSKEGNLYATGVEITGTINATGGTIGGFTIAGNYLHAESTDYEVGLFPNYIYCKNHKGTLESDVYIGGDSANVMSGVTTSMWVTMTGSEDSTKFANIAMYVSVQGKADYNDSYLYYGNYAMYIPKGKICGFRPRHRRINANKTLDVMDTLITCVATSEITLTLPTTANAEDGQLYFIKKAAAGNVTIKANTGQTIRRNYNESLSSVTINNGDMAILYFDKYNKVWEYTYSIYSR